ncbi:hypothetical protein EDB83DRAFT_2522352 [Lactarius deliciosus]|nr:hypothetical protein EDB83DRAFT_2522352 [Lactarius deliciosus]
MIFEEIESATFAVGLTAEGGPLQLNPDDVQKVFDHCSLTYKSLFGDSESTAEAPRLPSSGFMAERKSYEPLIRLLNIIVHFANNSGKPLKPDILGLFHPRIPDWRKSFWEDVVEVKKLSVDIVKQLQLSFFITIAFDHKTLTLRVICFHRSGVSASELLMLKEEDGFRSVVDHMVGILTFETKQNLA